MMLKEKSNPWARLKYLYVLPLAAIAVTAFARSEVSDKEKEISAVKVNDLAAIVETKVQETVPKVLNDTVKTTEKVVTVVGWKKTSESPEKIKAGESSDGETTIAVTHITKENQENEPLVIVDGKEVGYTMMSALKPERISSISVLKDKSATSIYGDNGKNGVIIVTLMTEEEFQQKKLNSYKLEMEYQYDTTNQAGSNDLRVSGKVLDTDGNPVIVAPKNAVLAVSYIDMKTSEVKVSSSPIFVILKDGK